MKYKDCRTMIRKLLLLAFVWLSQAAVMPMEAQEMKPDLKALYQEIDEAIAASPTIVANFEDDLARQKQLFNSKSGEDKLFEGMRLFEMYRSFKNDSALAYISLCIALADSLGHPDIAGQARAKMARQCSNSGLYVEGLKLLSKVNPAQLSTQGLADYYEARQHICGEVAYYSLLPDVKAEYYMLRDHYQDSLKLVVAQGSDQYMIYEVWKLLEQDKVEEALHCSDEWINKVGEGTKEDAMACYFRHIIYNRMGDKEMVRYWLGKSALADIRSAVMDQASLITLAEKLNEDGDMERSYKYIRFTWDCNNFFNTRMRSSQISPVLNVIEKNYQSSIERNTRLLVTASIVFTVLALLLVSILYYVYRQKKALTKAQQDLLNANDELLRSNNKLQWMNEWMKQSNMELRNLAQGKDENEKVI